MYSYHKIIVPNVGHSNRTEIVQDRRQETFPKRAPPKLNAIFKICITSILILYFLGHIIHSQPLYILYNSPFVRCSTLETI